MTLMERWEELARNYSADQGMAQKFWADYYAKEKSIYEKLLEDPGHVYKGSVSQLADELGMDDIVSFGAFLDGINESIVSPNPVSEIVEDSEVSIEIVPEKLYYNMVAAKADWLYELPQWDNILSQERREELYKEQKRSRTVVKEKKPGRNDPCPCGSGKKYKHCCGK